jgi:hypothetical protein
LIIDNKEAIHTPLSPDQGNFGRLSVIGIEVYPLMRIRVPALDTAVLPESSPKAIWIRSGEESYEGNGAAHFQGQQASLSHVDACHQGDQFLPRPEAEELRKAMPAALEPRYARPER